MNDTRRPGTDSLPDDPLPQLIGFATLVMALALAWPAFVLGLLLTLLLRRMPRLGWALELLAAASAGLWLSRFWGTVVLPERLDALRMLLVHRAWSAALAQLAVLWRFSLVLAPLVGLGLFLFTRRHAAEEDVLATTERRAAEERRRAQRAARLARRAPTSQAPIASAPPAGNAAVLARHLGPMQAWVHNMYAGQRRIVLGATVSGDLAVPGSKWYKRGGLDGGWLTVPAQELALPGVIFGASGAGKTDTALRLATEAAGVLGWQVIYLDAKGDYATAARFLAAMRAAGVERTAMFPARPYDGWRGDKAAILNRLLATQDFTEEYYQAVAKQLLYLALTLPGATDPPRSAPELLRRLQLQRLQLAYSQRPELEKLIGIDPKQAYGVLARYDAFYTTIDGKLDGDWAAEDMDAAYLLVDSLAMKDQTMTLGRLFMEDLAHYVARRKDPARQLLLIIDEYSALALHADAANLFERFRSYGASVFVTAQSYAGLGPQADRILDTANMLILQRTNDPRHLVERAGVVRGVEAAHVVWGDEMTGRATLRRQDRLKVDPDVVRQLEPGEAFVIAHGRATRVAVARAHVDAAALEAMRVELAAQVQEQVGRRVAGEPQSETRSEMVPQLPDAPVVDAVPAPPLVAPRGDRAEDGIPGPIQLRRKVRTRRKTTSKSLAQASTPDEARTSDQKRN